MLLASASAEKGAAAAKQCAACHTFEKGGPNRVGPNLYDIVNHERGTGRNGFNFSAAMKAKGGTWTFEELNKFLANPRGYIPGTSMTFAGLSRDGQRADLIEYLRMQADKPVEKPQVAAAPAPAKPAEAQRHRPLPLRPMRRPPARAGQVTRQRHSNEAAGPKARPFCFGTLRRRATGSGPENRHNHPRFRRVLRAGSYWQECLFHETDQTLPSARHRRRHRRTRARHARRIARRRAEHVTEETGSTACRCSAT